MSTSAKQLRIEKKGAGFTIGLTVSGGYVECWTSPADNKRLVECNFYDGMQRNVAWTEQAVAALTIALEWQRSGVMPLSASEP